MTAGNIDIYVPMGERKTFMSCGILAQNTTNRVLEWGEQELQFADPYAQKVFNERLGRMTMNKVRSVKIFPHKNGHNLDFLFADSSEIQSFEELKYFTSLKHMNKTFSNCPNLSGTLIVPASVEAIGGGCFFKTKLIGIEFLSQKLTWQTGVVMNCPLIKWIIMHAIFPQLNSVHVNKPFGGNIGNDTWKLYVPDSSVSEYRASRDYSYLGERIRPMSEFKE